MFSETPYFEADQFLYKCSSLDSENAKLHTKWKNRIKPIKTFITPSKPVQTCLNPIKTFIKLPLTLLKTLLKPS